MERKIAQCELHLRKHNIEVQEILSVLPNGKDILCRIPPAKEFHFLPCMLNEFRGSKIPLFDSVATWKIEVRAIVDILDMAKCAIPRNLSVCFRRADLVSNRLWQRSLEAGQKGQQTIPEFMNLNLTWKEGNTVHDTKTGLTIKYLSKQERQAWLDDSGDWEKSFAEEDEGCLEPPPSVFTKTMKVWEAQEYDSLEEYIDDMHGDISEEERVLVMDDISKEPDSKGWELYGYQSLEDACRQEYDCRSPDEAIWDIVGVPRLMVFNDRNGKKLESLGWKFLGYKPGQHYNLGDWSTKLGNRVVHAGAGVWQEGKPRYMRKSKYRT